MNAQSVLSFLLKFLNFFFFNSMKLNLEIKTRGEKNFHFLLFTHYFCSVQLPCSNFNNITILELHQISPVSQSLEQFLSIFKVLNFYSIYYQSDQAQAISMGKIILKNSFVFRGKIKKYISVGLKRFFIHASLWI